MGVRREVYKALGGFSNMRFGEDIDFSTRIFKGGYRCRLFPDAWVYHKRRTDLRKFFKQVHNSGIARIHLSRRHPGTHKLVHLLPAVFTLGVVFLLLSAVLLAIFGHGGLALTALSPLSSSRSSSVSTPRAANTHSVWVVAPLPPPSSNFWVMAAAISALGGNVASCTAASSKLSPTASTNKPTHKPSLP